MKYLALLLIGAVLTNASSFRGSPQPPSDSFNYGQSQIAPSSGFSLEPENYENQQMGNPQMSDSSSSSSDESDYQGQQNPQGPQRGGPQQRDRKSVV